MEVTERVTTSSTSSNGVKHVILPPFEVAGLVSDPKTQLILFGIGPPAVKIVISRASCNAPLNGLALTTSIC